MHTVTPHNPDLLLSSTKTQQMQGENPLHVVVGLQGETRA